MIKQMIVMGVAVTVLLGCKDEPVKDVQHYLDHPAERVEKIKECDNNPGSKALSPNCVNAQQAQSTARFRGTEMPTF